MHLDAVGGDQEGEPEQVVGVREDALGDAGEAGRRGLDALGDEHEARERARELVAALRARHALGGPGDLGDLVRRALADEAGDERAALAAGDRGDEESGRARRRTAGSAICCVAEQHEAQSEDEREHRAHGRVARALREARQHGGGGVGIDGVLVDDGGERVGHGACIGRFREDL